MLNHKYLIAALEKYPEKCLLINLLSKRMGQLGRGAKPLVDEDSKDRVNIALKELLEGKLSYTIIAPE